MNSFVAPHAPPARARVLPLPHLAAAVVAAIAVLVPVAYGPISPFGLAAAALLAGLVAVWIAWRVPESLVVLVPALMPIPLVGYLFPYEMALVGLVGVLWLVGVQRRADWLWTLTRLELALLAFMAWAFFTGFWSHDWIRFALGIRRLTFGFVALWAGYRLARLVPRSAIVLGLVTCAGTISLATLAKRASTGFSGTQAVVARTAATDLGWGWANYIAALLLILMPFVIVALLHSRERWLRWAAIPVAPMLAAVQMIALARGALLLFAGGIIGQLTTGSRRNRLLALLTAAAIVSTLLIGPWGQGVLMRFTSVRELGSGTIRIWYFREGVRRTLDNLPWGIGLQQGFSYPDKLQGLDPHNYWLDLSAELGFPGPLLWLLVLWLAWRRIGRVAANPALRQEGLALQVMFWISQIHTLVEPTFQGNQYSFLFFWTIGAFAGYDDVSRAAAIASPPRATAS